MGAIGVIVENKNIVPINELKGLAKKIPAKIDLINKIEPYPTFFDPKYKSLLSDEALVFISKDKSIRLSHYNLLVNTNSIQKALDLRIRTKLFCDIEPTSTAWAVFKAILPIYAGCLYTRSDPEIVFSFNDVNKNNGFQLRNDWKNIGEFDEHHFGVCPENTAALCIGNTPVHLTHYEKEGIYIKNTGSLRNDGLSK
ncbi:MAG: hypothetical protein Ct9H300mP9_4300 [Candidatus Neomarinimicrobiota bacterium]|nr:MAG: hypothetical protein Ct9H300mP9_4300 [Candidatus Neomarinimicrobiota bacterium]